ncbi:DUF4118 domain-containing protein [Asanoa iriomotensis]|uniref:Sensor protein KdpD transmembrane domain-containing protein n=1 Tax=Asanoa iriomotensis TaxID=234613 RepID=A0ABQ4CDT2_9ACTN|nr:DUF4118 domain-containing protein [Asanoa iriomotensis]GIF60932.1 hypothetical protein Air01nite_70270 [Asanoa iriomotensis]
MSAARVNLTLVAALVVPAAASAALVPARGHLDNTDIALVMVVVIVAVATAGRRAAGYLAAVSAGVWFEFFFTRPYHRFSIDESADVVTFVLLVLVGAAVTEIAVWGRRRHTAALRQEGYLHDIALAASVGATGGSSVELIKDVAAQLIQTLGLTGCRFQYGVAGVGNPPRLCRDGRLLVDRKPSNAPTLPAGVEIELLVESGGRLHGRYLLSAPAGTVATPEQRRVAVTLAAQVGAALG